MHLSLWKRSITGPPKLSASLHSYFLCCREEAIMGVSEVFSAPGSSESQKQMVWSIGKWSALDPTEDADMESW